MSLKNNLLKNVGAGVWNKISILLYRIIQIPLLLHALGVEVYGVWVLLYSIPSWLMLANLGFGTVAGNEMSINVGAKNFPRVNVIYSTVFFLILIVSVLGTLVGSMAAYYLPWGKIMHVKLNLVNDVRLSVFYLSLSTVLSFFIDLYNGRFRSSGKAHIAIFLSSFRPWLELLFLIVILRISHQVNFLSLGVLLSTIIFLMISGILNRIFCPNYMISRALVSTKLMQNLFKKGFAFQAFPLGNALLFQGSIWIVQIFLGPIAVTTYSTIRTLVRTINQGLEIINQSIWPEMSRLFGSKDYKTAARLHEAGIVFAIILTFLGLIAMLFFGQFILHFLLKGFINVPQLLLYVFLLSVPFNSLWFTSSVIHLSSNQHEALAKAYIIAVSCSCLACAVLCYFFGLYGAAFSTVISDIILIPFVFRKSLKLTQSNFQEFSKGTLLYVYSFPKTVKRLLQ